MIEMFSDLCLLVCVVSSQFWINKDFSIRPATLHNKAGKEKVWHGNMRFYHDPTFVMININNFNKGLPFVSLVEHLNDKQRFIIINIFLTRFRSH